MKKIVCLQNIYIREKFIYAGSELCLEYDVASDLVKRGIAKFVEEKNSTNVEENANADDGNKNDEPAAEDESTDDVEITEGDEVNNPGIDNTETPVNDDDRPKRGRPPKRTGKN